MGVENYHMYLSLVGEGSFGKTVAMKFVMKHGKSDQDIHNPRQEIEDQVNYLKSMIPNFKSFLKGLLHKTPDRRLTSPAHLEHPFVRETLDEQDSANDEEGTSSEEAEEAAGKPQLQISEG